MCFRKYFCDENRSLEGKQISFFSQSQRIESTASMHKPKVLFLHQGAELYGSDLVFIDVLKAAREIVHPIVVLDNYGPLIGRIKSITHDVVILSLGVLRRRYFNPIGVIKTSYSIARATWRLTRLVRRETVAIVYTNTMGVLPGAIAAKILGIPHIWHVHEIIIKPQMFSRFLSFIVISCSNRVITNSEATRRSLLRASLNRVDNVSTVYNGIELDFGEKTLNSDVRKEFGVDEKTFLIAMVGRIHYLKGQDLLLSALYELKRREFHNFKALIVGDTYMGYERLKIDLTKKVKELGLNNHVVFCGYREDARWVMSASDVVVIPSTQPESFGMVALEAMSVGRPIVATGLGGLTEIVEHGVTGYLVSPHPQELAGRLFELASDRSLREQMGESGRKRAKENFSIEMFQEGVRSTIISVLHENLL